MGYQQRYFLVADEKLLCTLDGALLTFSDIELKEFKLERLTQHSIDISSDIQTQVIAVVPISIEGYQWLGLRVHLGNASEEKFQLAGRALQIIRWHFDHQFCGRCGRSTEQHDHDLAKSCKHCNLHFYPRVSPCIITLVTRGDYCLLARHARTAQDRYSCLAGFIEPGESAEQTIEREVMEEVNIQVGNSRYIESQPWPFPGQLMFGYFVDYVAGDIAVDQVEIIAADWFRYDDLPNIPPISTISGRLIDNFVQTKIKQKNQHV